MTSLEQTLARKIFLNPQGAGIEELCHAAGAQTSRRTIQRRLEEWSRLGWVIRSGKARATRYELSLAGRGGLLPEFAPQSGIFMRESREDQRGNPPASDGRIMSYGTDRTHAEKAATAGAVEIPAPAEGKSQPSMVPHPVLCAESLEARDIVRQPQALREPVGYRREFLDKYVPGQTWYLPENLRAHLRRAGQSDHMAALPPGTYARQVLDRLLIDLSWNSSRLEGNTYSLLETDHLIQLGKADAGRWVESQMILNHKAAIEFLVEAPSELGYNRYTLLNLHAILTDGLLKDPGAEGRLRLGPVGIGGSVFHPLNNPAVLEECFDIILQKTALIPDPLEQCFFLMVHLPYLQAFEDGNKRVSRLSANLPLIQRNLSPLSFVDVTARDYADGILSVYELNRVDVLRDLFAWAYERSAWRYATVRQEIGEPDPMQARYREEIKERVRETVVRLLDKPAAAHALRQWATRHVTAGDRDRFVEMVERQLLGLNEGNIARVKLRPSELAAWMPGWRSR